MLLFSDFFASLCHPPAPRVYLCLLFVSKNLMQTWATDIEMAYDDVTHIEQWFYQEKTRKRYVFARAYADTFKHEKHMMEKLNKFSRFICLILNGDQHAAAAATRATRIMWKCQACCLHRMEFAKKKYISKSDSMFARIFIVCFDEYTASEMRSWRFSEKLRTLTTN